MPLIFNGHRGEIQQTSQQTIYRTSDNGDKQAGLARPAYTVYTTGSQSGSTNVDVPHYCNNTISFSHGLRQVETATVVATITQAGNGTFTVTAANSANLAAGKAISVAVALADTAILVAGKARTTLAADADVGAFFYVGGTGANIILYAKTAAANDTSMNCAMIDGTCIGITTAANSANTTAGDVTTHCIYDTASDTNQTGTTTSGNKIISGLTSTVGLIVGMAIGGNGVGAASLIATIDSATQVTGSVNSTVTNTVNITFTSTALFTTLITADTLVVKGTVSNNTTFTVATGANASVAIVTESVTNEAAGLYVTIYKRAAISNNVVYDEILKLWYLRYTTGGPVLKLGAASDGKLNWYDAKACFIIYVADGNVSMDATNKQLKITNGGPLSPAFNIGCFYEFSGFTIANNNRGGGYRCDGVTVSGSDLLLTLWTGYGVDGSQTGTTHNTTTTIDGLTDTSNLRIGMRVTGTGVGTNAVISSITSSTAIVVSVASTASASVTITFTTLATEAVGGTRGIRLVCRDIFSFAAAANLVSLGGYGDWRIPDDVGLINQRRMGTTITGTNQANAVPNGTVFPSWPTGDYVWSSTTLPVSTSNAMYVYFSFGSVTYSLKSSVYFASLLRG